LNTLGPRGFYYIDRQIGRQISRQTNRQAGRRADRQASGQAGRRAGRQAGRQTDRQTDRQTGRQAGRQTSRHRQISIFQAGNSSSFARNRIIKTRILFPRIPLKLSQQNILLK